MIVIVMGMHRSGTSAVAGMLHKNGVVMGREDQKEFYPPPIRENPKGFYENVRFRRLSDFLLKKYDYRVKSFSPDLPNVHPQNGNICTRMQNLIQEYDNEFPIWGWKDPRTILTAPAWLCALESLGLMASVRVILMKRKCGKIAESMRRRGNKERFGNHFEVLATMYYNRIYYYLSYFDYNPKVLTLDFEYDILKHTEKTCFVLSAFLGHPITDCSHIEPSISKSGKEQE